MSNQQVTAQNVVLYAAQHYKNVLCKSTEEFRSDFNRIKYIKRLIGGRRGEKDTKMFRLLMNHIICLGNIFGIHQSVVILFVAIDPEHYKVIKTCLDFLGYLPESGIIEEVGCMDTRIIPVHDETHQILTSMSPHI